MHVMSDKLVELRAVDPGAEVALETAASGLMVISRRSQDWVDLAGDCEKRTLHAWTCAKPEDVVED